MELYKEKLKLLKIIKIDKTANNSIIGIIFNAIIIIISFLVNNFMTYNEVLDELFFFIFLMIFVIIIFIFRIIYIQYLFNYGIAIKGKVLKVTDGFIDFEYYYKKIHYEKSFMTSLRKRRRVLEYLKNDDEITVIILPKFPNYYYIEDLFA